MSIENKVISTVSEVYGLDKEEITGKSRKKEIAEARQVVAYCLRLLRKLSFPLIGELLGHRDHTTAMHSYSVIKKRIKDDPEFSSKMNLLLNVVRSFIEPKSIKLEVVSLMKENLKENKASEKIVTKERRRRIKEENLQLTDREINILSAYRRGSTLQQIGEKENITRERVRQIIAVALSKEIGMKAKEGFEIDAKEFFKGEKFAHTFSKNAVSNSEKEKLLPNLLSRAITYTSIHKFSKDVGLPASKLTRIFPEVVEDINKRKKDRWSLFYIRCRKCGTTRVPHFRKGYCENCAGSRKRKSREEILSKNPSCSLCGTKRGLAIQKYGRDLYITRDGKVLCRGCFLDMTGNKLSKSRGKLKRSSL